MVLSSLDKLLSPKQYGLRTLLTELIGLARLACLPESDVKNALEALDHNESGLALDTILVQLFEYDVSIDDGFVAKARKACQAMNIEWDEYEFVETLVKRK